MIQGIKETTQCKYVNTYNDKSFYIAKSSIMYSRQMIAKLMVSLMSNND